MSKIAYHQGTSNKKKYKPEKRLIDRSRLDNFFSSYDLYDADNTGRPGGSIYSNLDKYDSVGEFLEHSRPKNKKSNRRIRLLKLAFDFPLDGQVTPILSDNDSGMGSNIGMTPIGGLVDQYFETRDFEGKTPENFDYTRPEGFDEFAEKLSDEEFIGIISQLINSPSESLIGLPDGLNDDQKDSTETVSQNYNSLINESFPGHSVVNII